jgi:hypothetical protein
MKEVINIQETTREKKQYVRPQITMIPMQAEHALLAASSGGDIIIDGPGTVPGAGDGDD